MIYLSFFESLLRILDTRTEASPTLFGWYHILCLALSVLLTIYLCVFRKNDSPKQIRNVVLITAIVVTVLEVYKQINYSFTYENGITFSYLWYAFPFQFCSTPMYVGLLAGLTRKGKVHDAACAYLATYAIFAGLAVMLYPADVFNRIIGINIQTMVCHGTMLPIGAYLYATGHVKLQHKTILKALCVFAVTLLMATIMNEIAFRNGITDFNMFYISPHCPPHLPVLSIVQTHLPYFWSTLVYIVGFTLVGYIMLLCAMGIKKLSVLAKSRSRVKTSV